MAHRSAIINKKNELHQSTGYASASARSYKFKRDTFHLKNIQSLNTKKFQNALVSIREDVLLHQIHCK